MGERAELDGLLTANADRLAKLTAKGVTLAGLDESKTVVLVLEMVREVAPRGELAWERQLAVLLPKWEQQAREATLRASGLHVAGQPPT